MPGKLCEMISAEKDEVKRLRKLRSAKSRDILGYPPELTTPKQRPERDCDVPAL